MADDTATTTTTDETSVWPTDERGVPFYSFHIGGLVSGRKDLRGPPIRLPRTAEFERGSWEDRRGNRGL